MKLDDVDNSGSLPMTRRRLLGAAAGMAAAAAVGPDAAQRAARPGAGTAAPGVAARHQARRPADAGEPLLRPLLRHAGRRPRLRRPDGADAAQRPNRSSTSPTREPRAATCCPSTSTPAPPARRRSPRPATPGPCSTTPGTAARWTTGCRPTARPTGNKAPYVMGYHTRADIPFQFALAEAFTICDAYHCSVMGPTWPNRMYWMTGTIDPDGKARRPDDQQQVRSPAAYRWTTYAERLEKAGVSWKVYQQQDNYGCNMLEYFKSFQEADRDSPLYNRGHGARAGGQVRVRRDQRQPAGGFLDHPDQHAVRASGLHAGGRRGVRGQQDRRHRGQPGGVGEDGVHPQLRRERRHLRPRRPADRRRPARRRSS